MDLGPKPVFGKIRGHKLSKVLGSCMGIMEPGSDKGIMELGSCIGIMEPGSCIGITEPGSCIRIMESGSRMRPNMNHGWGPTWITLNLDVDGAQSGTSGSPLSLRGRLRAG